MTRIDTHHHLIPDFYRAALRSAGIDAAGGRALPDWSPEASLATMAELNVDTAILSVSTPGTTFLPDVADAVSLARRLNDYNAEIAAQHSPHFGFFATLPTPHETESVTEAVRALDDLGADGVTLLANSSGTYLGEPGLDDVWSALDQRKAVVFIHPADLPAPPVEGIMPFAADFLLDTTRAAYLLVRNNIVARYPNIRFILSHAGGFVPYASHRMAVAIAGDVGRSPLDVLNDFASFYFDTALSSSAAALPTLLAFAKPGHILFGSDWPFAPATAGHYFAAGLEQFSPLTPHTHYEIDRANALALFPRLAVEPPTPVAVPRADRIRSSIRHTAIRLVTRTMTTS